MFALVGFAVGYVVGAQAGREGMLQLVNAAKAIQSSDEFAALVETARTVVLAAARQAFETGTGVVTGEMKDVVNRRLRAA